MFGLLASFLHFEPIAEQRMSGKSRVGKSTAEQIKAFNVAVQQYNAKSTDR